MHRVGDTQLLLVEIFDPFFGIIVQPDHGSRRPPDVDMMGQRVIGEAHLPADLAQQEAELDVRLSLAQVPNERINPVEHPRRGKPHSASERSKLVDPTRRLSPSPMRRVSSAARRNMVLWPATSRRRLTKCRARRAEH
jgi:hypothetical protein